MKKRKKVGELCVCGEGEKGGGRWGERREVGELCVCGRKGRWGESREVLHMILFRGGGGGSKYFGKVRVFAWRVAI